MPDLRDALLTHLQTLVDATHAVALQIQDHGHDLDVVTMAKVLVLTDNWVDQLDTICNTVLNPDDPEVDLGDDIASYMLLDGLHGDIP
jgi:hypothetical protein